MKLLAGILSAIIAITLFLLPLMVFKYHPLPMMTWGYFDLIVGFIIEVYCFYVAVDISTKFNTWFLSHLKN